MQEYYRAQTIPSSLNCIFLCLNIQTLHNLILYQPVMIYGTQCHTCSYWLSKQIDAGDHRVVLI